MEPSRALGYRKLQRYRFWWGRESFQGGATVLQPQRKRDPQIITFKTDHVRNLGQDKNVDSFYRRRPWGPLPSFFMLCRLRWRALYQSYCGRAYFQDRLSYPSDLVAHPEATPNKNTGADEDIGRARTNPKEFSSHIYIHIFILVAWQSG